MVHEELRVETGDRLVTDLTASVEQFVRPLGEGICHLFVPHATAGLALMELGSGSESDLAALLERWLPRSDPYHHAHGSLGHGRDHLLPVIVSPSLSIPVHAGRCSLGTWQSIVLVDSNVDNPVRRVELDFLS